MEQKILLLLCFVAMSGIVMAQDATSGKYVGTSNEVSSYPQIVNVGSRDRISLDGWWKTIPDQYESGYYNYRLVPYATEHTYFADRSFAG